ncbi:MAG: hypothetical protein WC875_03060 [Candidatus Absconditabacterales bacterium]|jgi:hypothetical protein
MLGIFAIIIFQAFDLDVADQFSMGIMTFLILVIGSFFTGAISFGYDTPKSKKLEEMRKNGTDFDTATKELGYLPK